MRHSAPPQRPVITPSVKTSKNFGRKNKWNTVRIANRKEQATDHSVPIAVQGSRTQAKHSLIRSTAREVRTTCPSLPRQSPGEGFLSTTGQLFLIMMQLLLTIRRKCTDSKMTAIHTLRTTGRVINTINRQAGTISRAANTVRTKHSSNRVITTRPDSRFNTALRKIRPRDCGWAYFQLF